MPKKDVIAELNREQQWEMSLRGRFLRGLMFKLGFSKCRHCLYCYAEASNYRGMRESILLRQGECKWSRGSASSILTYEDLRRFHRCPAFISVLYNFKDYAIDPSEVEKITSIRLQHFFTWMGWIVAILIALFK